MNNIMEDLNIKKNDEQKVQDNPVEPVHYGIVVKRVRFDIDELPFHIYTRHITTLEEKYGLAGY